MRILVVAQRYGAEVVGGSESHARTVAHRLARRHDVEVATTTALDHWTWAEHYRAGEERDDDVLVRRFRVRSGRAANYKEVESRALLGEHGLEDERAWLRAQGPHVPDLLEFVHRAGQRYEAVLFYTYIYEPTVLGVPIVPERAALIPTAHDERPLRLALYRSLFQLPRAFGFLTREERALVHREFHDQHIPDEIIGIGLDAPPAADAEAFRARHGLRGPIVLYLGQVTEAKAVDELLAMWSAYRNAKGEGTLVLAGNVLMSLPPREDVVVLGRVSDAQKWSALAAADALVLPSHLESLGIVLLEAWQAGTPVIVPAWNAVTAGQVQRAGGGVTYATRDAFPGALGTLLSEGRSRGGSGRDWVERECAWPAFDARLDRLVDMVAFRD